MTEKNEGNSSEEKAACSTRPTKPASPRPGAGMRLQCTMQPVANGAGSNTTGWDQQTSFFGIGKLKKHINYFIFCRLNCSTLVILGLLLWPPKLDTRNKYTMSYIAVHCSARGFYFNLH